MKTMILASTPSGIIGDNGKLPWPHLEARSARVCGGCRVVGNSDFSSRFARAKSDW